MASSMISTRAFLVVLAFAAISSNVVYGCGINIVNSCPYSVTTCAQSGGNPISQYQLGSGATQFLDFGSACSWPAGAIWASVTGQCANPTGSGDATDRNLANLAEFTIGGGTDNYDLSNVNAYTIGLSIAVLSSAGETQNSVDSTPRCGDPSCVIANIRSFCQGDNRLDSLPSGALSCINTDGTNGIGPTAGTNLFHNACPNAYAYNFDDANGLYTCNTGVNYQVTFCPGGVTHSDE